MAAKTELFLDDALIEQTLGVTRRIHQPRKHKRNPVFRPERWWESNCILPLATIYDREEKCFKMWYRTGPVFNKEKAIDGHVSYTAYATSADGIHWERPELGVLDFGGRRDHSVVLVSEGQDPRSNFVRQGKKAFILSVVLHPYPRDESEKYVCMFFDMKKRGAYLGYSADGIRWRRSTEPFWRTPVDASNWGDDTIKSMIYDQFKKKWVMYRRLNPQESERLVAQPGDENWQIPDGTMRVMGYADSADLKKWENYRIIMIPDADDPSDIEFYGMTCYNYEQVYVGYLWIYHKAPELEKIDIQLVTSRDGINFTRCCRRETFLPGGLRNYYDYMITVGYQAEPIIINDQVYLYYQATNADHSGDELRDRETQISCGLATFSRDRFVSLHTGQPENMCRVVTKPMKIEYPKLFLNAATWGDGKIQCEVLSRDWKPIPGFTVDEATPIHGNALAHPVRWKNNTELGVLAGREIRLKFYMAQARIHAMIQETEERPLGKLPDLKPHEAMASHAPKDI